MFSIISDHSPQFRPLYLVSLPNLSQMDLVLIALAEAAVERERQNTMLMELSLRADDAVFQEKKREREMLKTNKEEMLADDAAKEKLVADFMVFMEAIENNDPDIAHKFDEKAMMNTILTMMKTNGGDNGGIGGGDNVPQIKLDVEEKPTMDATLATNNSDGNSGRKFVSGNGGINNAAHENAHNLGDGGMTAAIQGTNSDGSEGGGTAGIGDSCNRKRH